MPVDKAIYLDPGGLECPLPLLRTRKQLDRLGRGGHLIIERMDPLSVIDIPHLMRGGAPTFVVGLEGVLVFHICRRSDKHDG